MVARRLPTSSNVRWNFHSRAINTVFEQRDDLIQCFENIRDSGDFDSNTIREAGAMAMLLEHQDFKFFLELFHHIMPLVDLLYAKLQKKNIDAVHIKRSIQQFEQDIQNIRNSLHSMSEQSSDSLTAKRRRVLSSEDRQSAAEEICNTILRHTRERFNFTDHLVCATLLQGDRFEEHHGSFPEEVLQSTLKAYPMLNGSKLKTELSLIYSKAEFRACCGAVDLFQLFMENNLQDVFSETVTLLRILITTPMTTAGAERMQVVQLSVLFLVQTHFCWGQYTMVTPSQVVMAPVGSDITLPCQVEPAADLREQVVEWARLDLTPPYVHIRRDGLDLLMNQNPLYLARTALSESRLQKGDLSLSLSRVKLSDEGTYRCCMPRTNTEAQVTLRVAVKRQGNPQHEGRTLRLVPDTPPEVRAAGRAFNTVCAELIKRDIRFRMAYPAILSFKANGGQKPFKDPNKAEAFLSSLT
uniref:Ig-like domain-containing protein n=1 Tax=Knipowitschia caucasica TaxID=637954 RepID=A0AAV2KQF2_KNICA